MTDDVTGTAEAWQAEVDGIPALRAAFTQVGNTGNAVIARAQSRADSLDVSGMSVGDIAVELQQNAAARKRAVALGAARDRARVDKGSDGTTPARARFWEILATVALVVAFAAVITAGYGPRSGRWIAELDVAAGVGGSLALIAAVAWLLIAPRAPSRGATPFSEWSPARQTTMSLLLVAFNGVSLGGTLFRLPDEPDDLEPVMIFGILAFAAAVAVHLLTLWVLRRGAHVDTSLSEAETLRVMDEVLRGEPAASARLRRVAFAEGVRVLLARGAIDVVEARELLRVYTR